MSLPLRYVRNSEHGRALPVLLPPWEGFGPRAVDSFFALLAAGDVLRVRNWIDGRARFGSRDEKIRLRALLAKVLPHARKPEMADCLVRALLQIRRGRKQRTWDPMLFSWSLPRPPRRRRAINKPGERT